MGRLADYTIGVVIVMVHLVMVSLRERRTARLEAATPSRSG